MQSNPSNSSKMPIIITVIVVVASAIYYFYYSGGAVATSDQSTLSVDSGSPSAQVGSNVLELLNQINSLNIDTGFFKTPVYQSLIDFSVAIPPVPVGRPNPFSPIGGFVSTPSTPASTGAKSGTAAH